MVRLDKIVTKAGDGGKTRLATGEPVSKASARVQAYGAVDEANSAIGVARLYTDFRRAARSDPRSRAERSLRSRRRSRDAARGRSEVRAACASRPAKPIGLKREVDQLNEKLTPLTSFILPGGTPAAAHLHLARAIARRAERAIVALS
jgi:cob(I)alamin adenosyltransferase